MKLLLAEEMREVDRKAREEYGLPELVLMENAGRAAADMAVKMLDGKVREKHIVAVCGSGNNGGDAFSAVRYLLNDGANVKVFLAGSRAHLKESPAVMLGVIEKMGAKVYDLESGRDFDRFRLALRFAELILDGVLGTGFAGELRKKTLRVIEQVNEAEGKKLAIDIPSGVEADTGKISSVAVKADATITFGTPKPGHYLGAGKVATGHLAVDGIGIPDALLTADEISQILIDDALAARLVPHRPWDAYKGSVGKFLVIAGSRGMTGAGTLASMAALRVGAGLVTLAVPESLNAILEEKVTEVMTLPCPEEEGGAGRLGGLAAIEKLSARLDSYDAILIGPGLGRAPETMELVRCLAKKEKVPLLLDADGIYAFRGHAAELKDLAQVPILTPHLGEMATLLDISIEELKDDLLAKVRKAAGGYQAIFVLKSERTLVAYPDGDVFFTTKGNAGMATGGAGDVLAGTILGLMTEMEGALAPVLGVYLHGAAGDRAFAEKGNGLLASDLLDQIPLVRKELEGRG